MSFIPTPQEALEILSRYNEEAFHIAHAQSVAKVMRHMAAKHDPGNEDFWEAVGLLHDIDFERWPEEHCVKAKEILTELDIDPAMIHAVVSHGYGIAVDTPPEHYMEKVLFATDELTGLIGAVALMRPTGMEDLETKSVMKKFKTRAFAAGCSREVIAQGAEMLGLEVPELVAITLEAMKS